MAITRFLCRLILIALPLFSCTMAAENVVDTIRKANVDVVAATQSGNYQEGLELARATLTKAEAQLSPEHPVTLTSVNNLAFLYDMQGRYGEAEPLYKRALETRERVLGLEHPNTLISANNLAAVYYRQGRYGEVEPLLERTLVASERELGSEHPNTLTSVNNLASLYRNQGRYGEAESLVKHTLEASERVRGIEHPGTLVTINNLAGIYRSQGRYGEAEALYKRALEASERVRGREHPETLAIVNNLATIYENLGRYGEAEPLYKRSLEAREKLLGPEHPDSITSRGNLTGLLVLMNRDREALGAFRTLDQRLSQWLDAQARTTRAAAVRRLVMEGERGNQDVAFSFALSRSSPQAAMLAADLTLGWKKRLAQDDAVLSNLARKNDDPTLAAAIETLKRRRADLSNAAFDLRVPTAEKQRLREVQEVAAAELRAKSSAYRQSQEVKSARAQEVQTSLQPGTALVEYRFFDPYDFPTGKFGASHLLVVVITPEAAPAVIDLGEADALRILANAVADKDYPERKGIPFELLVQYGHDRLIAPLLPHLKDARSLYIAPDGPLHTIPFEALMAPDGQMLIQRMPVHMLQTGRDLVARGRPATGQGLVAVGGVDFGPLPATTAASAKPAAVQIGEAPADNREAALTATREQVGGFRPLKESGTEAENIAKAYTTYRSSEPAPIVLTGKRATEAALKALKTPPRVLHLATHGYYLQTGSIDGEPLLQSGVALAGANRVLTGQAGGDGENGILHAVEAQTLNLYGTELVVLSACDTGKGVVDYSEGLEGLPRAFYVAGAKNVLAALWAVGDLNARIFMERFYQNWLSQSISDPAAALRQTKLEYITSPDPARRNPDLWSPFVLFEG